jgi:steroid delta-isomerase-like uncharacterized protein
MADQDIINLTREMLGATVTDDFVYDEVGTQRRVQGRQECIEFLEGWKQAFPDFTGTIKNIFVSGNQALAEIVWDGTFKGDLVLPGQTIRATGKSLRFPAALVLTVEGGKVKEVREYSDLMTPLQQ